MTTHTPGPWFFDTSDGRIFQKRDPLVKYVIAELECSNDADGFLIAAAPELLAALHKIADLGTCGGRGGFQKALDIAVSAICKATRGAS